MNDPSHTKHITEDLIYATNGQLTTPALSPISEDGEKQIQPLPGHDTKVKEEDAISPALGEAFSAGTKPFRSDRRRSSSNKMLKLSPEQIQELVAEEDSIPVVPNLAPSPERPSLHDESPIIEQQYPDAKTAMKPVHITDLENRSPVTEMSATIPNISAVTATPGASASSRPSKIRSSSTPMINRKQSSSRITKSRFPVSPLQPGEFDDEHANDQVKNSFKHDVSPLANSSMPTILPVPPLSLPTYLQLELSSDRPSALYLHRPASSDFPYESSQVKFERLLDLLQLPMFLEEVLWFGAIACLDAWLYTFTILPLRFFKAIAILSKWLIHNALKEGLDILVFIYDGIGRLWSRRSLSTSDTKARLMMTDGKQRQQSRSGGTIRDDQTNGRAMTPSAEAQSRKRHRRTRSSPSALLPNHKADMLQGLLIICSCTMLMYFDASRSYHSIRGQSAIKLYVIYNVLEVFDRLLSALGQDILECLFSKESLERDEHGRSKILRPLWMFVAALVYSVVHAAALFYQVVTLNVAVNSYSNALLTLLMSNQFVEIKGTVFKKFEKDNLFQLTCADIVERFQLWLMLVIIALRNIVEVGGLSISLGSIFAVDTLSSEGNATNMSQTYGFAIPRAFTLMPKWTGEVLGPFIFVLLSEMAVDWLKHGYISKFNNVKPNIYGRFLDVLAKDYYSHAFVDQNLTKRLGLPVIPLSCLFIRACMQTYHMFLATHMPLPMPSLSTSLEVEADAAATSPATTAALQHIDQVFRRALGRSSFGAGTDPSTSRFSWWSIDDLIAFATMITFFLALYLILLACKLLLGMLLLSYSRRRYRGMRERERERFTSDGKRVGGWGVTEVGEEKRRWIYQDDPDALRDLREKEEKGRRRGAERDRLDGVERYHMAAKRIW
nr:endoplasmic reticulum membrane protein 65 [Quercus suber]